MRAQQPHETPADVAKALAVMALLVVAFFVLVHVSAATAMGPVTP